MSFRIIADMVKEAEDHTDKLSNDRLRAMQYEKGEMIDTPHDDGRSGVVSRDVRSSIKKALPSVYRTILGKEEIVEFQPVGEDDEEYADQASDYINHVVIRESRAKKAIKSAIHDALLLRNGILKAWFEEKQVVSFSTHTGLTEDALAQVAADDDVEIVESETRTEQIDGAGMIEVYDVKLRRTETERKIRAGAVQKENLLLHPDALSFEDSLLVGEKTRIRRSDLVAMGFSRERVAELSIAEEEDEEGAERRDSYEDANETHRPNQWIDYYDLFVRIDMDDDGISELRHMCFAGGLKEVNLLIDEEVDEVQFYDITPEDRPHNWEGVSVADDTMEIQRINTVLLRQTIDNLYWQNNPQPTGQKGAIENPDALLNPEFGKPIWIKQGFKVQDSYGFTNVPFVAKESFSMLEYMKREAEDRTGITDASAGLPPDALQNVTAKASAMLEQQGIGQTEMIVETIADGLAKFFAGLLKLAIRHQDVPRTVRLRKKWVTFDPRQWNAKMDCTVNTGLGAGTRERDMQMMQIVMQKQAEIVAGLGPDNPFVRPENVANALSKFVEAAGLRTPGAYFTTPEPGEVEAKMQEQAQQPSPEQQKLEMQMQLEQQKMQTNSAKEQAQMEADLHVKSAEIEAESRKQADKLASDAALQAEKLAFEREKFQAEMQLRREEMASRRQDDIFKHQAQAFKLEAAE